MNIRRPLRAAALAGALALGLTATTACSSSGAAGKKGDRLAVTASFYPMEFLAKEIGGEHVRVKDLTGPGTEPHDLELGARETADLAESDVIVYLKGVQPAVDAAVQQTEVEHIVDAAALTPLKKHGAEVGGHSRGEDGEHGEGGEHEAEGEDGHDHGADGADPHIWLDPVKYAQVAKGVGKTLAAADPAHQADYARNTDNLVKKLADLNKKYADGLKNRKSDTFITTHAAFGYLAERYGLTEEAISGIDPESGDVSGSRIKELHGLAGEHHVGTVFFETLTSPDTARTLARDLNLKTDVLDPVEGITDKSRGKDYIEVMEANLTALQKALGAK
ncbi:metal ABC transporter substrate-binding protein [Streptomyces sp. MST-110588]|uniref:metal ABC transporter substrate-binding protein n=1 Tax=Streptomyces sp. MST-110588 TaxID=2833628 RepID=UPI001F5CE453|nr:metal ABC transporter substrate-binding protein [Streptomyces sp. MST-110588]UNO42082.1 zinc ABC transporter substrate-binding protein [Streptomyces sp. MST-110588]